nr:hypothetical protein [Tanacetum cinerariifolium]
MGLATAGPARMRRCWHHRSFIWCVSGHEPCYPAPLSNPEVPLAYHAPPPLIWQSSHLKSKAVVAQPEASPHPHHHLSVPSKPPQQLLWHLPPA